MPARARSLRLKLASWFVLVFFLIQTVLVGGVVLLRREMIKDSLDGALSLSAEAMIDNILLADVEWDTEQVHALVPTGSGFVLCAIRNQDGDVLVSWGLQEGERLPLTAWEVVPAGPVGSVFRQIGAERARVLTGTEQRLRLITVPFKRGEELFFFQAGVRDQVLERLLGPFVDLVLVGIPVGIAAALFAAWFIAGRAVYPMRLLSRAARGVSPTSLSERFEVSSTDEEVRRLEDELNSALARLEAGYRAQDQFISNASHELRTPVAVLLTQAQVAKMGERTLEKGYAFVEKAEVLLQRLGKIVDGLLMLARADLSTPPPSEPVSVTHIVLACLQTCKLSAEQSGVRLIPRLADRDDEEPDLILAGDAGLLQTMLENLVGNAIDHSPRGGVVGIEAEASEAAVRIIVRDQGPGIPEEYLDKVFDRFFRVPRDSSRHDGAGLGLAIAHGIAQLHGGTIEVRNNEGAGCSFVATLPAGRNDDGPGS